MKKKILFLILLTFSLSVHSTIATSIDSSYTEELTAFEWIPITDADKIMQYENQKNLTPQRKKQADLAAKNYTEAVSLMKNKEYDSAIKEFKAALKRYKRAKLSADAMNFIYTNMALSYANSGNREDLAQAERLLNLLTSKVYNDNNWAYNIAIAHSLTGNQDKAASILTSIIRKDNFYFQAYVTLEEIYRKSGNENDAEKVNQRMQIAENKLNKRNKKSSEKVSKNNTQKKKKAYTPKAKKPDITNLKIVVNDDHLQFNNKKKINERNMLQIQEGIGDYDKGLIKLSEREPKNAQKPLKDAEKKLKRGKVTDDGLNFVRGNLVIACLATEEKRGVGQAKRYLRSITSKLYKKREWTYNMAVAYYQFAFMSARKQRDGSRKWTSPAASENIKESIKLFKKSIKQDKLFLTAYENLMYIYKEQGESKKAKNVANSLIKARTQLMQSFSKEDQLANGLDPLIFRLNLGTFGSFDTPSRLFDEPNVVAIPMSEETTTYLSGLFYNIDEVLDYQQIMQDKGYSNSFVVGYKNGEKFTDF